MKINRASRVFAAGLAFAAISGASAPVVAQDGDAEARLRKVEAEVRALQRKVFPGGDGRFFEPEITSPQGNAAAPNTASTSAVSDILVRLDALEAQIASLTAQTEQNSNAIAGLTGRLDAIDGSGRTQGAVASTSSDTSSAMQAQPAVAELKPASPSPDRVAAVSKIAKPQTDDPGDDEYSYGFRLWDAGFYPEAQQQLTMFVEKYPDHSLITYGRNLLGRAYLDDGKPSEAATWFYNNYQADKNARRAPDSLLYLAESMIALNDTRRACIALAEFGTDYPAVASGRLSDQFQTALRKVDCN